MKTLLPFVAAIFLFFFSSSARAQGSGNALKFDGNDDHVVCGNSNRGITHTVSVEAWVKTTSMKYHWVVGKYDRYGGERGYHLIIKDGKAAFAGRDGSGSYRISGYSPENVNDGQWHHLTGICNNGVWQIYVDGILKSELKTGYTRTDLTNSAPLALGKDFLADSENFNGLVDEVRIWKKALTQEEIRNTMCTKLASTPAELVAYFNFDTPGASLVKDLSSQKLDGTFRNMNPSSAWVTSGAPIGDESTHLYTSVWQGQKTMLQLDDFSAYDHSSSTKGFHLYYVSAAPNTLEGIRSREQVKGYYGIFKVGSANDTYTANYKPSASGCAFVLYRRQDNSDNKWATVVETSEPSQSLYKGAANAGEFVLTYSASVQEPAQPTEYFACGNTTVTLTAPAAPKEALYLWSNGQTSESIEVAQLGLYTVTVTVNGCSTRYAMTVSADECPIIPNIITPNGDGKNDVFLVEGVAPSSLELEIFNRWGKSIYRSSAYDNTWGAQAIPAGAYYYHLKSTRSQKVFKGWLEVVK